MIDNFALVMTHMAILVLFWRVVKNADPDDPADAPKTFVKRPKPRPGADA